MRNFALFALAIAILCSAAYAYKLEVKVTVTQETPAVGTNISIVSGGVEIAAQKANASGSARFDLSKGSYFVRLARYPYPIHVSLIEVENDSSITLTMRQLVSYTGIYGQVSGPADFSGAEVVASSGGQSAKRATPNKDGLYLLSYLPEGIYDITFTAPGFEQKKMQLSLVQSDFAEVNPKLAKTVVVPEPQPVLSAPKSASRFSLIEVSLTKGGLPMAGQKISAQTPAGAVEMTTDAAGKAYVNAAEGGNYKFSYANLSAETSVPLPEKPPAPPPPQEPEQPAAPQQPEEPSYSALLLSSLAILVLLGGLFAVLLVLRAFLPGMLGRKKAHGKPGAHEGPEMHAKPHAGHMKGKQRTKK